MTVNSITTSASIGFSSVVQSGNDALSSVSFGSVMSQSIKMQSNSVDSATYEDRKAIYSKAVNADETKVQTTSGQESTVTAAKTTEDDLVNSTSEADEDIETQKTQDTSGIEAMMQQMLGLFDQIFGELQKVFSVNVDELKNAMDQLNITPGQLVETGSLQQLTLFFNGNSDLASLLTDGTLSNQLQQAIATVDGLLKDAGIIAEEFQATVSTKEFDDFIQKTIDTLQTDNTISKESTDYTDSAVVMKDLSKATSSQQAVTAAAVMQSGQTITLQTEQPNVSKQNQTDKQSNITDDSNAIATSTDTEKLDVQVVNSTNTESDQTMSLDAKSKDETTESSEVLISDGTETASTFLQNLAIARTSVEQTAATTLKSIQDVIDVSNQLLEQIRVVITPEKTSMEMQLNPESLGRISMTVSSKEGAMTASIITQTQAAKEAIEGQIHLLYTALENQGLKVDAVEVAVSSFSFNQESEAASQQQQQQNSGSHKMHTEEEDAFIRSISDDMSLTLMEMNGNSVDYVA